MHILHALVLGAFGTVSGLKTTLKSDPIGSFIPDGLLDSEEMKPCYGPDNGSKGNRKLCAKKVFLYERRIRKKLEQYLKDVVKAQNELPALDQIIKNVTTQYQESLNFLQNRPEGFMAKIRDGESALTYLEMKHEDDMTNLIQNFENVKVYANAIGKYLQDQNTGMLNNISTALTTVLANQTEERKTELNSVQLAYEDSKNQILEDARAFVNEYGLSLDALDEGIKNWQEDQKGNITMITESLRALDSALKEKQTVFTEQVKNLTGVLTQEAFAALQEVRDEELQKLGETNTQVLTTLNKTNEELNAVVAESDLNLRNEDEEYANSLRAKVVQLQQGVLGAYDGLYKMATQLSTNITNGQNAIKNEQAMDQAKLDQIMSDIANATEAYSDVADATKTRGLLTTRKILATLARMLDDVKAAMKTQESSFASAAGNDLLNRVSDIKAKSEEAKKAAAEAAQEVGAQVADTSLLAGMNTQQMFAAMSKLLGGISKLSDLIKAKVGQEADKGTAMLDVVNSVIGGATGDLASSLEAVSAASKARNLEQQQKQLGMTTDVKLQGAQIMNSFEKELDSNMNSMDKVYNDVRASSMNAVQGTSNLVSDSQRTVSALQDATLALDGVVGQSAAQAQEAWSGVTNVVDAGEKAAAAAIQEASAVLKQFVTTQAKARGQRLVEIAQLANTTFRNAFTKLSNQVSESNKLADQGLQNVLTGTKETVGDLDAYEVSLNSLLDQLDVRNKTTIDMLFAMKNESQARWDAWLDEQIAGFKTRVNASDAELESEFTDRLASLTGVATQLITGVRAKLATVTEAIVNTTGDAKAATLAANQSISDLAATQTSLEQDAASARTRLEAYNADQEAKFANLTAQVNSVVSELLTKASTATSEILNKNASVYGEILNTTNAIKDEVTADTQNFATFVHNFTDNVRKTRQIMNDYEKDQSGRRLEVINNVTTSMNEAKNDLVQRVMSGNLENYDLMQRFVGVLGDIADAQGGLASGSANATAGLSSKVNGLMQTVFGLKDSMLAELDSAFDRLNHDAALEAAQATASGKAQMAAQSGAIGGVGNKVLNLLDGVLNANEVNGVGLSQDQVAVYQLASMVQGLSKESAQQLRDLMAKISNGEMSLEQGLDEATKVNADSLETIGEVAEAFQMIMAEYLANTGSFFDQVTNNITSYNTSAFTVLDEFHALHENALAPITALANSSQALVDQYVADMTAGIAAAQDKLKTNEETYTQEDTFVKDKYANISLEVETAANEISKIRKEENEYVDNLLKEATQNVTTELNTMLSTYFPNVNTPHNVEEVKWTLPAIAF